MMRVQAILAQALHEKIDYLFEFAQDRLWWCRLQRVCVAGRDDAALAKARLVDLNCKLEACSWELFGHTDRRVNAAG